MMAHLKRMLHHQVSLNWGSDPGALVPCVFSTKPISPGKCIRDGALSLNLFGSMWDVRRRIDSDGVSSDWEKIGGDLRSAIEAEQKRRDRESQSR